MLFQDSSFLIFLFWTVLFFYIFKNHIWQKFVVLSSSILFIAHSGISNLIVVLGVMVFIQGYITFSKRYGVSYFALVFCISLLLLNLFIFKYSGFVSEIFGIASLDLRPKNWMIPLGISFYTFQLISALIDFQEKNFFSKKLNISLFTIFFPQIIAGPIVRYRLLGQQLNHFHSFKFINIQKGLYFFTIGYCKKVLIADPLASIIDPVWASPSSYSSTALIFASIGFYIQLYADFSGYTDMGRGAARMLGFRLPINFKAPYLAYSPAEFWQRWHMTLSFWVRNYFFQPFSVYVVRRVNHKFIKLSLFLSILFVMIILGFWHGANWTFGVFGLIHGLAIAIWYALTKGRAPKKIYYYIISIIFTQLIWISSLIFFRSDSLGTAFNIFSGIIFFKEGLEIESLNLEIILPLIFIFLIQLVDNNVNKRHISRALRFVRSRFIGLVFILLILFLSIGLKGNIYYKDWEFFPNSFFDSASKSFIYFEF
ncbi:hypothetical protein OAK17_02190 [Alphaproteobacteria bacterium]|nr:hypothetical protein [Alphaproteobacteria bacterium]